MSDQAPKSAYELAMERLRQQDRQAGVQERPLSEAQKADIAEARRVCEAKIAERKILYQAAVVRTVDPAERAVLDDEYRQDVARYSEQCDQAVQRIRQGD